jgi:hypothetical protein
MGGRSKGGYPLQFTTEPEEWGGEPGSGSAMSLSP